MWWRKKSDCSCHTSLETHRSKIWCQRHNQSTTFSRANCPRYLIHWLSTHETQFCPGVRRQTLNQVKHRLMKYIFQNYLSIKTGCFPSFSMTLLISWMPQLTEVNYNCVNLFIRFTLKVCSVFTHCSFWWIYLIFI